MTPLKIVLEQKISEHRVSVRKLLAEHGDEVISSVSVAQAYGGLRGVRGLVTETSTLDPAEGIRFRGYTIPQLRECMPRVKGGQEPLPEGMFYLLLTGEIPDERDTAAITTEWRTREALPPHVLKVVDHLPKSAHPMTQLSVGIMAMQTESVFARSYREGLAKEDLWQPTLEDALTLIARLPPLAAFIYRRSFRDGKTISAAGKSIDWAGNFAHLLGNDDPDFAALLRLYLFLLSDHEGGNVSAHTIHLVGSALADPYQALAAGMNGLAGPLHGLANQEALRWIREMQTALGGGVPSEEQVREYVWETLRSGRVVPGFGHAVLRRVDPRYLAQRDFALKNFPDDQLFKIVSLLLDVVPGVLEEHGKAKSPWPNVDAHTGALFAHFNLVEYDFYTVLFGVSRAIGTLASLVWDRALGLPIERPKSVTTEWIREKIRD